LSWGRPGTVFEYRTLALHGSCPVRHTASTMGFVPGDRVGKYELLREIGKGGMATVFEAEHKDLGKKVAIKVLHEHLAADANASARFLREGKAAAQIHHPNVVDVFDI